MRSCVLVAPAAHALTDAVQHVLAATYDVVRCTSGITALRAATTAAVPDLLALLLPLPGLTPAQVAGAIRGAPGRGGLPVVLIGGIDGGIAAPVAFAADAIELPAALAALAPGTCGSGAPLLDDAVLAQLRGIPGLLPRVRDAFLAELDRRIADIVAAPDAATLHRAAHTLKGGAAGAGARALSLAAAAIDHHARSGAEAPARNGIPALVALVAPTRTALAACA